MKLDQSGEIEADAVLALNDMLAQLEVVALRVKEERDVAVNLLRECLLYQGTGDFARRVKQFLGSLNAPVSH